MELKFDFLKNLFILFVVYLKNITKMIKNFSVENYKSFPNKVTIDFTANNYIKDKKDAVEKVWKYSIVKNAIIYWQNAVWKTYLLKAMDLYFDFIRNSFTNIGDIIDFDFRTYWNNDKPITFEAEFIIWTKLYNFFFKIKDSVILTEILKENWKVLYEREEKKIKLYKKFVEDKSKLEKLLREDALLVSLLWALNDKTWRKIVEYAKNIIFVSLEDNISFNLSRTQIFWKQKIEKYKNIILELLKMADFTIEDMEIEEEAYSMKDMLGDIINIDNVLSKIKAKKVDIYFKHINWFVLEFSEESSWTKKFFDLILFLLDVIENEKILLVDEFEDNLHYEIAKQILKFINLSPWKSQFIFTTHNIEFMDLSLLRKDQIFLINKNEKDEKEIYKLDDFKDVRKTYNVRELYKAWIFWAYPIVEDFTKIKKL